MLAIPRTLLVAFVQTNGASMHVLSLDFDELINSSKLKTGVCLHFYGIFVHLLRISNFLLELVNFFVLEEDS